ncbi:diguanylate cyclase (GGDEF)-like protein [Oxalobacteraceae bacterium GrIS 2.11]
MVNPKNIASGLTALSKQVLPQTVDTAEAPSTPNRLADWILGTSQRGYLKMLLMTAAIYTVAIGLLYFGVLAGLFDPDRTLILAICCASSTSIFYLIMRSGLNTRFSSPTLVIPQTIVAQTWIVMSYCTTGPAHGGVLILLALVMVFDMFNMPPRQAKQIALYTVILLGLAMWYKCRTEPQIYLAKVELVHFILVVTSLSVISRLALKLNHMRTRLKEQKMALEMAIERIREMAVHDELTGLCNRRHLRSVVEEHINRQIRGGQCFYIAILDLDHFKRINDSYGHQTGDEVLKSFSALVLKQLRNTDIFGRWGGEEFLLLCLDPKPDNANLCLTRLQTRLRDLAVCEADPDLRITFSAGMTRYEPLESIDTTIARADRALYEAKAAGRDLTVVV